MSEPAVQYPIDEQIAQAIQAELQGISEESGYGLTPSEVERPRRTGEQFRPKDLGLYLHVLGDDPGVPPGETGPAVDWRTLTVAVDFCLRLAESDARPMDQVFSIAKADIVKAIKSDETHGGLALETRIGSCTPYAEQGFEGLIVTAEIDFATPEADRYSNGI